MVASSKIMIKQSLLSTAAVISLIAVSAAGSQPAKSIWYNKPANDWKSEALSIGNSCMGAMLFGGITEELIQFNEQSLWSGDINWGGAYECGDHGFGSYRTFGDVFVTFAGNAETPIVTSPSGQEKAMAKALISPTTEGKVTNYRIASKDGQAVKVRVNWEVKTVNTALLK